jgi:hypothetical protein
MWKTKRCKIDNDGKELPYMKSLTAVPTSAVNMRRVWRSGSKRDELGWVVLPKQQDPKAP